jgi:hypothetical protein
LSDMFVCVFDKLLSNISGENNALAHSDSLLSVAFTTGFKFLEGLHSGFHASNRRSLLSKFEPCNSTQA